jgi:SAM-dependent methyltransferase
MPASDESIIHHNREQAHSETDRFTEERYRQFHRHLPPPARVILDVGCNTGRGGRILKQLRPASELWGLDCVPERVAALDPGVYARPLCAFTQELPVQDRSVDAIIAGEFLEHLPPSLVEPTLCEFFRVLTLRGVLLLTTPNPGSFWKWKRGDSVVRDPAHLTQHHPAILKHRLLAVGFSGVRIRGSGRASRRLGEWAPRFLYGSYLMRAVKW